MPRVKLAKKPQEKLGVLINGTVTLQGKNTDAVARILDCSAPTARDRLRHPETLTVAELVKLCRGLGVPADEIRAAIVF